MVQPLKYAQRDIAVNIADEAVNFLEAHLNPKSTLLETTAPPPKQVKGTRGAKQPSNTSSSTVIGLRSELSSLGDMALDDKQTDDTAIDEKKADDDDDSARIAHIDEMRDWLLGKPLRLESGMYGPITAF
ncbi:hypothetical protein GGF41_000780, partial [Coemansia sp. RSA 2531]